MGRQPRQTSCWSCRRRTRRHQSRPHHAVGDFDPVTIRVAGLPLLSKLLTSRSCFGWAENRTPRVRWRAATPRSSCDVVLNRLPHFVSQLSSRCELTKKPSLTDLGAELTESVELTRIDIIGKRSRREVEMDGLPALYCALNLLYGAGHCVRRRGAETAPEQREDDVRLVNPLRVDERLGCPPRTGTDGSPTATEAALPACSWRSRCSSR